MKKKYITRNMLNGSVHIVMARSYWRALDKARKWFGSNSIRVWEDKLSSQLS